MAILAKKSERHPSRGGEGVSNEIAPDDLNGKIS
jgi:hypothetical protein